MTNVKILTLQNESERKDEKSVEQQLNEIGITVHRGVKDKRKGFGSELLKRNGNELGFYTPYKAMIKFLGYKEE